MQEYSSKSRMSYNNPLAMTRHHEQGYSEKRDFAWENSTRGIRVRHDREAWQQEAGMRVERSNPQRWAWGREWTGNRARLYNLKFLPNDVLPPARMYQPKPPTNWEPRVQIPEPMGPKFVSSATHMEGFSSKVLLSERWPWCSFVTSLLSVPIKKTFD